MKLFILILVLGTGFLVTGVMHVSGIQLEWYNPIRAIPNYGLSLYIADNGEVTFYIAGATFTYIIP